jgi:hypothetical protein
MAVWPGLSACPKAFALPPELKFTKSRCFIGGAAASNDMHTMTPSTHNANFALDIRHWGLGCPSFSDMNFIIRLNTVNEIARAYFNIKLKSCC